MPRFHEKITGSDYDSMADLVRKFSIHVNTHTVVKVETGYRIGAHADGAQIHQLEAAGYNVERYWEADAEGKLRQREVRKISKQVGQKIIQETTAALLAFSLATT